MNLKEQNQKESRAQLKGYIKPSSKILIIVKSVSASGMTRRMKVLTDHFADITYLVAGLCDLSVNDLGLKIGGCGMDMTFWLADRITHDMGWSKYKNGKHITAKGLKGNGGTTIDWATA